MNDKEYSSNTIVGFVLLLPATFIIALFAWAAFDLWGDYFK